MNDAQAESLFTATAYLLMRQLNAEVPDEGPDGNRRLQEALLGLVASIQPDIFLDIGANDGAASIAVRAVAPSCMIHAFEANPSIQAKNRARLEALGITTWNLAIDRQSGRVTVYVPRTLSRAYIAGQVVPAAIIESEDTGKSSLLLRNEEATYEKIEVEATTLDAFIDAHVPGWQERTIFLWVDVEGAADRVLAGGTRLLHRTRAIFLETEGFEFWQGQADSTALVTKLISVGFLPIARDREYGDKQFNILFIHRDVVAHILPDLFNDVSPLRMARPGNAAAATEPLPASATILVRPSLSLGAALQADIPVIIPCFNAVTYARQMVNQLRDRGLKRIILVDNASTYQPMLEFLAAPGPGVTVVSQAENKGPRDVILDPSNFALLPQFFCVTDPDLVLNPAMPEDFLAQLAALTERLSIGKAGLAINISEPETMRQQTYAIGDKTWHIWEWEQQFWNDALDPLPQGDPVYRAFVDTTFAVYNRAFFKPEDFLQAVRVAGRYTCRHLPWYPDVGLPFAEEQFYRCEAKYSYYLRENASDHATTPRY